jgi:hypothetical protein
MFVRCVFLLKVLSWLCKKGEDTLKRHSEIATNLPAIKEQEQDFEKFYFISMVSTLVLSFVFRVLSCPSPSVSHIGLIYSKMI